MASMAEGQLAFEGAASDFQSLEEKIYRVIELLKAARAQKAAVELELVTTRETLEAQAAESEALRRQLQALHQERNEVRSRVEKLLGEVDQSSNHNRAGWPTFAAFGKCGKDRWPTSAFIWRMWEGECGVLAVVLLLVVNCTCLAFVFERQLLCFWFCSLLLFFTVSS